MHGDGLLGSPTHSPVARSTASAGQSIKQPLQTVIGNVNSLDSTRIPPANSPTTRTLTARRTCVNGSDPRSPTGNNSADMMPHPGSSPLAGGTKPVPTDVNSV